jgi:hypothetical protein
MKTSPAQLSHFLNATTKSRITIAIAIISFGLAAFAESQVDFCEKTAQDALDGCQKAAQSALSVALGKFLNISDRTARADCQKQAVADFQDALQTCQDGYASPQAACQKFGPARYNPVIDPANFVRHVTNSFFSYQPDKLSFTKGRPRTVLCTTISSSRTRPN